MADYDLKITGGLIHAGEGDQPFSGDIAMLTGSTAVVEVRAIDDLKALVVPFERFPDLLAASAELGEKILRAFVARRRYLESLPDFAGAVQLVGDSEDPRTYTARQFLQRNRVPFRFIESSELQPETAAAQAVHDAPIAFVDDLQSAVAADLPSLAQLAGIQRPIASGAACDLAIIGAGPSGLAAAVYAASEGLTTYVFDRFAPGGQAATSSAIENYPGFLHGQTGAELTSSMFLQCIRFGAEVHAGTSVEGLSQTPSGLCVTLETGCELTAGAVLIATGAEYQRLDVPRLDAFEGRGVYYVATDVEARVCEDRTAVVVGGGNSAGQAIVYLSRRAKRVIVAIRGASLEKGMSSYLSTRIRGLSNVEVLTETVVESLGGEQHLESVSLRSTSTGSSQLVETPSLFSFIGAKPCTSWLPLQLVRDEKGFLKVGEQVRSSAIWMNREDAPLPLETSVPGVFAVGDVRSGSTARVAAAAGDGAFAVTCVWKCRARSS